MLLNHQYAISESCDRECLVILNIVFYLWIWDAVWVELEIADLKMASWMSAKTVSSKTFLNHQALEFMLDNITWVICLY